MEERIISVLKETGSSHVSGEELSKRLGVTRASIWKHIENLRAMGYDIMAQPHLGYKLISVPDKLLAHEIKWKLATRLLGHQIYSYQAISSTNDTAYRMAEEGAAEGIVIVSEQQTAGKGRIGRRWTSPKGGIYLSLILRPSMMPTEVSKLTLVAAVSVAETLRDIAAINCSIKWPNDILVGKHKICGILTELKAEQDVTSFVILGIGINVNTKQASLPKNATSIRKESGAEHPKAVVAKRLLENLELHYLQFKKGKFNTIIEQWKDLSAVLGKHVKIAEKARIIEGQAIDIDSGGALVVRLDNGFTERVLAGDVILVR